jgi:hypothetical protein
MMSSKGYRRLIWLYCPAFPETLWKHCQGGDFPEYIIDEIKESVWERGVFDSFSDSVNWTAVLFWTKGTRGCLQTLATWQVCPGRTPTPDGSQGRLRQNEDASCRGPMVEKETKWGYWNREGASNNKQRLWCPLELVLGTNPFQGYRPRK